MASEPRDQAANTRHMQMTADKAKERKRKVPTIPGCKGTSYSISYMKNQNYSGHNDKQTFKNLSPQTQGPTDR